METTVNGAKAKVIPLKNYNADLDAIAQAIDKDTRIVALLILQILSVQQ